MIIKLKSHIYLIFFLSLYSPLASSWHNQYDWQIRKASHRYLPTVPWQLYKAQLIQESLLNPHATSPRGAKGIAQFMPSTWAEVCHDLGLVGSPMEVKLAIPAGAYYMSKLRNIWKYPREEEERHNLALACYNAGCSNVIRAQKLCGNPSIYKEIMQCLPQVMGKNAKETLSYAPKVQHIYEKLTHQ